MAVKMRLMRMGKKKSPYYRVVVMDGRAPRDGRYIDLIGRYDPRQEPSMVEIDTDKAVDWLRKGAQPTEAVTKLLEISGAMARFKVAAGKIHTVAGRPEAATAEQPEETPEEPAATEPVAATAAATEESAGDEESSAQAGEADQTSSEEE